MRTPAPDAHPDWDALFDGLLAARREILAEMVALTREELPAYRDIPDDVLLPGFDAQFEATLQAARTSDPLPDARLAEIAAIGEARALQGVPVEDMLRAWRISIQALIDHSARVGRREGVDASATLAFARAVLAWSDGTMLATATAHRRAELELARQDHERRATLVRGLLLGTLPLAQARDEVRAYGLDAAAPFVAVRGAPAPGATTRDLGVALGLLDGVAHRPGLRTTLDGDLAGLLARAPEGDVPGVVGVGPPVPLDHLAESFRLATRALHCAQRFGLAGVHSIDGLGLRAAVADDEDVGAVLARRYLEPLGDPGGTGEIAATVRTWLACSTNVERTAEQLIVHANTVRYRLGRFEELTGASLRETRVAFEVWWALEHAAARG